MLINNHGKEVIVVGSGPNGLAAAITMAQAGYSVLLQEANQTMGGGARSEELTLPGFIHDTCSAVHPLAVASPFFQDLPLEKYGLKWITPPIALAHPFDDGSAACLYTSLEKTADTLGPDALAYKKWMEPFQNNSEKLFQDILKPIHIPRHPWLMARFGWYAMRSTTTLANHLFKGKWAKGLLGGLAAHSFLPLSQAPSAAIGLMLAMTGHANGWPFPQGGSQKISDALLRYFQELGGKIVTGNPLMTTRDLPEGRIIFFDLHPFQLVKIAGDRLSPIYRKKLEGLRSAPAVFKLDWALSGPIPWTNAECRQAGTVHLGGTLEELEESEKSPWLGKTADKPFVLLSQLSLFDSTRAPKGQHTVWAYCHVPRGSSEDMTEKIENQIERFAPGFKCLILAKKVMSPVDVENHNANFVGGDISGGVPDLLQILFRPTLSFFPYSTSVKNWYLCSASTPPGAGVHGLCGYYAARFALKRL